jgi:hypothetical protein
LRACQFRYTQPSNGQAPGSSYGIGGPDGGWAIALGMEARATTSAAVENEALMGTSTQTRTRIKAWSVEAACSSSPRERRAASDGVHLRIADLLSGLVGLGIQDCSHLSGHSLAGGRNRSYSPRPASPAQTFYKAVKRSRFEMRYSKNPAPTPFTLEKSPCSIRASAIVTLAAAVASRSSNQRPNGLRPTLSRYSRSVNSSRHIRSKTLTGFPDSVPKTYASGLRFSANRGLASSSFNRSVLPALQGTRADRRRFTLEVEDRRRDPRQRPCAGFLEADADQVAAHQRDDSQRVRPKRPVRLSRTEWDSGVHVLIERAENAAGVLSFV